MNTFGVLLSLSLATVAWTQYCPSGFVMIRNSCYHYAVDNPPTTWKNARTYCQSLSDNDGTVDLATVAGYDLFHELYKYQWWTYNPVDYWIGGTDEDTPSIWHWVTGTMMPKGHPYWYPGEPSGSSDHCAFMDVYGFFRSEDCDYNVASYVKYSICQWFPWQKGVNGTKQQSNEHDDVATGRE